MSDDANVAVESPRAMETPATPKQRRKKQPANARPKTQPPYAVVVFNDEEHTFEYVTETLMKVFRYPLERSRGAHAANPHRRQGDRVVRRPRGGGTEAGSNPLGRPGFLRGEEGGFSPDCDR